jgi:hypothetical protein
MVMAACGARTELTSADGSGSDAATDACGTSFGSDPTWTTLFGPAVHVCLSAADPPGCPTDAILYGASGAWHADISHLDGAAWIWRPGISASSSADLVTVTFTHVFSLHGIPTGTISIAADDFAEVDVNGALAGTVGSITDVAAATAAQSSLAVIDISSFLVAGRNTILIIGKNGPASFTNCSGACTYAENPAGVVFGGSFVCP